MLTIDTFDDGGQQSVVALDLGGVEGRIASFDTFLEMIQTQGGDGTVLLTVYLETLENWHLWHGTPISSIHNLVPM